MRLIPGHLLLLTPLLTVGCLPSQQAPVKGSFQAPDTPGRVPAIVHAANTDQPDTLGKLVHALSDKDPAVRLFAIQSLEQRTGETMGYRYYEPLERRQAATDRWLAWLTEQGLSLEPILSSEDAPEDAPQTTED